MLTLFLAASAIARQTPAPAAAAPSPFNYSVMYDLRSKATIPIVGMTIGSLPRFLGTHLQPEMWAIGGLDLSTQHPDLGFAAVLPYKFSTNGTAFLGGAVRVENGEPISLGVIAGIKVAL